MPGNQNEIEKLEHDDTYHTKKVSLWATDVNGNLARVTQATLQGHPNSWTYHVNGSSALTDATVQAAPGANLFIYVTDIEIHKDAATAMNVFFEYDSTKVYGPVYLEAVAGRGFAKTFKTPLKIPVNKALTVTSSAAIAHAIDVQGFIAP